MSKKRLFFYTLGNLYTFYILNSVNIFKNIYYIKKSLPQSKFATRVLGFDKLSLNFYSRKQPEI